MTNHHKTKQLIKYLGPHSFLALIDLWFYARSYRPDGDLSGLSNEQIAISANWDEDPDVFVRILLNVGFIDQLPNGQYVLHEWAQHQPHIAYMAERTAHAKKAAEVRWGNSRKR